METKDHQEEKDITNSLKKSNSNQGYNADTPVIDETDSNKSQMDTEEQAPHSPKSASKIYDNPLGQESATLTTDRIPADKGKGIMTSTMKTVNTKRKASEANFSPNPKGKLADNANNSGRGGTGRNNRGRGRGRGGGRGRGSEQS